MTKPVPAALSHLQFLTMKDISPLTTYTPQHIYRLERSGQFPRRVRIGPNRVAWKLSEIEKWLAEREIVRPANDNEPNEK